MEKKLPNFVPSIILIAIILGLVALFGALSIKDEDTTTQGQADVTEVRISSKVPGRIKAILVEEGQYVHAGDTLALLDAPEVDAKLSQAMAAVDAASAISRKAEHGTRIEQQQGAYEMWQKAKAGLAKAENDYRRAKNLYDQGVTTKKMLDDATVGRDAAIATERAAKSQYDMAKNGAQQEDKDAASAQTARARSAVSEVNAYKGETVLIAQQDGEVLEIFPQIGELVGTGAPIMTIGLMDKMWVAFNIREDHLSGIAMNQKVKAIVPALDNKEVELVVYQMRDMGSYAAWKATKTTGQFDMKTFEVKARPTAPIEGLRPGMSVLLHQ